MRGGDKGRSGREGKARTSFLPPFSVPSPLNCPRRPPSFSLPPQASVAGFACAGASFGHVMSIAAGAGYHTPSALSQLRGLLTQGGALTIAEPSGDESQLHTALLLGGFKDATAQVSGGGRERGGDGGGSCAPGRRKGPSRLCFLHTFSSLSSFPGFPARILRSSPSPSSPSTTSPPPAAPPPPTAPPTSPPHESPCSRPPSPPGLTEPPPSSAASSPSGPPWAPWARTGPRRACLPRPPRLQPRLRRRCGRWQGGGGRG